MVVIGTRYALLADSHHQLFAIVGEFEDLITFSVYPASTSDRRESENDGYSTTAVAWAAQMVRPPCD